MSSEKPEAVESKQIDQLRTVYKQAKKDYKSNKDDETLKKAMKAGRRALEAAEAKVGTVGNEKFEDADRCDKDGSADEGGDKEEVESPPDLKSLQKAYDDALATFKVDKSNKDLRRAKTAAAVRRTLETASSL